MIFVYFQTSLELWCSHELKKIENQCVRGELGCWLWGGALTKNGYGQKRLTVPHLGIKSKLFYIHRLTYSLKHVSFDLPCQGEGWEVSHLCHSKRCANPEHLSLETHEVNGERRSCDQQGHCTGGHKPQCLFQKVKRGTIKKFPYLILSCCLLCFPQFMFILSLL